jgi:hypothetical protein
METWILSPEEQLPAGRSLLAASSPLLLHGRSGRPGLVQNPKDHGSGADRDEVPVGELRRRLDPFSAEKHAVFAAAVLEHGTRLVDHDAGVVT